MKLLTLNIWCTGPDCKTRISGMLKIIKDLQPDIICLQEVPIAINDMIRQALTDHTPHYDDIGWYHRLYGEITFVRTEIIKSKRVVFAGKNTNMRSFTVVTTANYTVINTHLDLEHEKQLEQLQIFVEKLTGNVIIAGDLNFKEEERLKSLNEVKTGPTFRDKKYRPDRIYYRDIKLKDSEIIDMTGLSDHDAVVAVFE